MEATDAKSMSKQEKLAWLGLVLTLMGCIYLIARLFLSHYLQMDAPDEQTARQASRVFMVFLLGYVLVKNRGGSPFEDERDRQILARRLQAGYTSLALMLVLVATVLGLDTYADSIASLTAAWMESFVMLMLLASFCIHFAVGVFHYWCDRR